MKRSNLRIPLDERIRYPSEANVMLAAERRMLDAEERGDAKGARLHREIVRAMEARIAVRTIHRS